METPVTYDAFISYRHAELDTYVAENLHRMLESFHLPAHVSRKTRHNEKTKITRIFRDRDELPLSSDLSSPIHLALENSEFLIVICSPRTPESAWVQREIETFISLHDREHVLAVLIEGEPRDSFPLALTQQEEQTTLPDGSIAKTYKEVEPLAADVRGNSKKEIRKKLKQEILRLVAPMFQCNYDDLKQRHRERKIKRTIRCLIAVCAFLVCFGSYSTYQAIRIRKQSKEIVLQAEEIQTQYTNIFTNNLYRQSEDALALLKNGDRMGSVQTALLALPENSADTQTPFVPNAQYALTESLYVYQPSTYYLPSSMLRHNIPLKYITTSPSGEHLLTIDDTNKVHIWDMNTEQELSSFSWDGSLSLLNKDRITFLNDSEICYMGDSNLTCYNFKTKKISWEIPDEYSYTFNLKFSPSRTLAAIMGNSRVSVVNLEDGSLIYDKVWEVKDDYKNLDLASNNPLGNQIAFSSDEKFVAFSTNFISDSTGSISIIDLSTSEIVNSISVQNPDISCIEINGDSVFLAANTYLSSEELFEDSAENHIQTQLYCYHYKDGSLQWQTDFSHRLFQKLIADTASGSLIAQSSDTLFSMSLSTGNLLQEIDFDTSIINSIFLPESYMMTCFTVDGKIYMCDLNTGYYSSYSSPIPFPSIRNVAMGKDYMAVLPYDECNIMISRAPQNPDAKKLLNPDGYLRSVLVSAKSRRLIQCASGDQPIQVFDYPSGEYAYTISSDDFIQDIFMTGNADECLVVLFLNGIGFYDSATGKELCQYPFSTYTPIRYTSLDETHELLYLFDYQKYHVVDLKEKTITDSYAPDSSIYPEDTTAITAANGKFAVANTNTDCVDIWEKDFSQKLLSIPVSTYYIQYMFLNPSADYLFIVYQNLKTEVYNVSTGELEKDMGQLAFAPTACHLIPENSEQYILCNNSSQYLCTANHEILAYLPQCYCIDTQNMQAITYDFNSLYTVPIYTLDELIEKAKEVTTSSP